MPRRRSVLLAVLLATSPFVPAAAGARDPAALDAARAEIERWLALRGLAPSFELQKLRWQSRDDDQRADWLELDLRFVTIDTEPAPAIARFIEAKQRFEQASGVTLAEALLFKLTHAAGIARNDAHITIWIIEDRVAAVRDTTSGLMVFKPARVRMARPVPVALETIDPGGAGRALQAEDAGGIVALRRRIDAIIEALFANGNSVRGLPAPKLDNRNGEANEVRMDVSGIRKVVIADGDFWERLQISIVLSEMAQTGVHAMCFVDGSYAAGKGLRVPDADSYTAMLDGHQADLDRFAATLMREVLQRLARRAR